MNPGRSVFSTKFPGRRAAGQFSVGILQEAVVPGYGKHESPALPDYEWTSTARRKLSS